MSASAWYRLAQWATGTLPRGACGSLAEGLADVQWRVSPKDRAAVQANLSVVVGQPVPGDASAVREVFRNFARYLVEFVGAHRAARPATTVEGTEEVKAALRPYHGAIMLSAHLGNWELGAVALHRLGFRTGAVVLPHRDARVNRFFDRQRLRCGVEPIALGVGATARCLQRLREGWLLGLVGDREFGTGGVTVSFFGRSVTLPRGPALLSLRSGAPAVPVFVIREGPWRLRFHVGDAVPPPANTHDASQVVALTQRYARIMEEVIRRYPSQWLMFQPLFAPRAADAR